MKLRPVRNGEGEALGWAFYCPGCDHGHVFYTSGTLTWSFNGDVERPTFTPSLLNTCPGHPDPKMQRCHLVLTAGKINFCTDCTHDLASKSVDLVDRYPD